jgi:ADP-ribosylglycohydrolase
MNNPELLDAFFDDGAINLHRSALFATEPSPLPDRFDFERIEGMMLGLAIGDALGNTSEGQFPQQRTAHYGEIRDYLPNRYAGNQPLGLPSDDTQLAFWTLQQMLDDGEFVPEHVACRFSREQIFGIGSAVKQFARNHKNGSPWHQCGPEKAGNGALMRIAPMLIPYVTRPSTKMWADTALSAMMTHNDYGSSAACLAFTAMLWDLLAMKKPPEPEWWLARYVALARDLEGETKYQSRCPRYQEYRGPIWRFVNEYVTKAYDKGLSVRDACNDWFSGAYLLETIPSVIYILMRHGDNPEEALVRSVNDTWDNDTVGAIVGAAVGALHGKHALPKRWMDGLSGRTKADDDGEIDSILRRAEKTFGPQAGTSHSRKD